MPKNNNNRLLEKEHNIRKTVKNNYLSTKTL